MITIGYIRVSSNKQTLEHQRFEITNFALKNGITIDKWIEEKISSRKAPDSARSRLSLTFNHNKTLRQGRVLLW